MDASRLREALGARRDGHRTCVPILGSGVNLQAVRLEGRREDDWAGLLARIATELKLPADELDRLPRPHLFRWESMLRLWARARKVEAFQAETELQRLTCVYLKSLETTSPAPALYREFANARFADMISLNFDRRIALGFGKPKFIGAPSPCPHGSHGETFYRHDLLQHADGACTRVWYPHGDTRKTATLKLGVRKYGFYIGTMAERRDGPNPGYSDDWRYKRAWYRWDDLRKAQDEPADDAPSWVDAFLGRPIVFIGCGLSSDEWPLWWSLRDRADTSTGEPPPAWFVTGGAVQPAQAEAFAEHGIEILSYPSYDQMWDEIRAALA